MLLLTESPSLFKILLEGDVSQCRIEMGVGDYWQNGASWKFGVCGWCGADNGCVMESKMMIGGKLDEQ